jgi:hypothetical protein
MYLIIVKHINVTRLFNLQFIVQYKISQQGLFPLYVKNVNYSILQRLIALFYPFMERTYKFYKYLFIDDKSLCDG